MANAITDSIGLDYRINLAQLANSIRGAKNQLAKFHKDLASLSKKASITITIHDKKAKAQVKRFANAMQAELDKTGRLRIKTVAEPFAKMGGAVPRMTKDYEKLHKMFGQSPALLGKMNSSFKRVNDAIGEQAIRMQNAGKNGLGYYKTANRVALVQQELKGTLKTTATGFKNVAAEQKKATLIQRQAIQQRTQHQKALQVFTDWQNKETQAIKATAKTQSSANASLHQMGITSATTTKQFQKMNFAVADHDKIARLTRQQIGQLRNEMASGGKVTAQQSHQFNRLNKRLEHSSYQVRKQTSAMGDARRAQERWGAGFKYMMLSQTAWIASGAIIFGTLGAITQALRDFLDFNQGLVDAAAITQATASGYKRMEIAAMKAFKSSTMGAKEATDALKILGQAGMDATDSAIALETVYKVTTATGGSTTEVVKFLTTAINVWKLSAEEAAKVGNILGAALNYSKLEVEDLTVTFNYVASMAKTVGMSITDLAATMAVMANAGIKASTIGTGLRGVFSKLIASTPKFRNQLKAVGLTMENVNLITNDFFVVLKRLQDAKFDVSKIFGGLRRREAASLNVIMEQGVERFNLMREALKDTTAIQVMFERSMKGMKNQLILTGHQIQAVLIDALKVSQPIVIGIAKSIQALVITLRDLSTVLIGIGTILATWKIGAMIAGAMTTKFAAGFTAATTASSLFFKALKFLKSHWILTGLTLLIGGYTAIKTAINAATESTKEFISKKNREIDDLRKLQVLLLDVNRSDKDKLEILADYAKQYEFLLPLLDQQNLSIERTVELITEENKKRKELIETKSTEAVFGEIARLTSKIEELKRKGYRAGDKPNLLKRIFGIEDPDIAKLEKQLEELWTYFDIKTGFGPDIEPPGFDWTADMVKLLEKLRYDQATALEQAQKDYEKDLAIFKVTEEDKSGVLKKELENRDKARKYYLIERKKLEEIKDTKGIESPEYKKQEFLTNQLKNEWERRKTIYADLLEGIERVARKHNEKISEINEKAAEERQKLLDKAYEDLEKRVKIREKAEAKSIKTVRKFYKDYEKFQDDLTKKLIDSEEDSHEKRIKLWDHASEALRKKYNNMLKVAEDYYDELMEKAERSPVFKAQAAQIRKLIIEIKKLKATAGLLIEKRKPKDPRDLGAGMMEGLRKYRDLISDEYKIWENMAYESAMAMQNSFSDLFFDAMMGDLHSLSDYWKSFTTSIKRMIANAASMWLMFSAFGSFGSLFGKAHEGGLIKAHSGDLIKKMHSGGPNLKSDETIRILKDHEYVIKDSSTKSIGVAALDYANRTGRLPQTQPQQITHKHYTYVYAIDSESMDLALRKRGAGAIGDISLNANAYARGRQDPRVSGRGRY